MPTDIRFALLVLGAALLLAALASMLLKRLPAAARVLMAVCGAGLLAWGVGQQLLARQHAEVSGAAVDALAPVTAGARPLDRTDLVLLASSSFADCSRPGDPTAPPDGNSASRAQMLAAQQAMTSFDAATTAYARCVDVATQNIVEQYQQFVPASEVAAVRALDAKVHNDAVDEDQVLVGRFNEQLRIFKAKQTPNKGPLPPSN